MIRLCSVIFPLLFGLQAVASDSARVSRWNRYKIGAFGGFGVTYMETGREAVGLNFQGGLICNRWLAAGLHGNAFFTLSPLADRYSSDDVSLLGVYGGVFAAPIICPKAMIHASIPVCAGYGTVSYGLNEASKTDGRTEASSRIWVLEPGIEVELNLINFIRIAIGGYYRYCGNVKLGYGNENVAADIFNNFSVGIRLRFGKF